MSPTPKSSKIMLGCLLVILLMIGALAGVTMLFRYQGNLQQMTRPQWQAAERKWEQQAPANYDITVEVDGRRAATYRVEVRDGMARSATHDGVEIRQKRLFSIWSVPGMFTTLDREFALQANQASGQPGTPQQMQMYGEFNPLYGYPQSYQRLAVGGDDISWEVTEFIALPDDNDEHPMPDDTPNEQQP